MKPPTYDIQQTLDRLFLVLWKDRRGNKWSRSFGTLPAAEEFVIDMKRLDETYQPRTT